MPNEDQATKDEIVDQYEPPSRIANGCGCVFKVLVLAIAVSVSSFIACLTTCGTVSVTGEALGFRMSTGYPIASPSPATFWASIFVGLIFGFFVFWFLAMRFWPYEDHNHSHRPQTKNHKPDERH